MKQVTIVVPNGHINLSSITGSYEILTRANQYWQKAGNKSLIEIRIAGFVKELNWDAGFFSVYPTDIKKIRKTDLVIIPSLSYDYDQVIRNNKELISWINEQYKGGAEIA